MNQSFFDFLLSFLVSVLSSDYSIFVFLTFLFGFSSFFDSVLSSYYSLHSLSFLVDYLSFFGFSIFYLVTIISASSGSGKISSYFSYLSNYKIFAINFSVVSNLSYVFLFSLLTYLYQFLYLPLLNLSISTFNTNFSLSDLSLLDSN